MRACECRSTLTLPSPSLPQNCPSSPTCLPSSSFRLRDRLLCRAVSCRRVWAVSCRLYLEIQDRVRGRERRMTKTKKEKEETQGADIRLVHQIGDWSWWRARWLGGSERVQPQPTSPHYRPVGDADPHGPQRRAQQRTRPCQAFDPELVSQEYHPRPYLVYRLRWQHAVSPPFCPISCPSIYPAPSWLTVSRKPTTGASHCRRKQ